MMRRVKTAVFSLLPAIIIGAPADPCAIPSGSRIDPRPILAGSPIDARALPGGSFGSQVVINEVYYDHPGPDAGWEFVELLNTGPVPVPLAGYRLEHVDGLSGGTRTLWECGSDTILAPGGRFLVAGENVSCGAVGMLGSIENGPDAVQIVAPGGLVDLVGYGECTYCEDEPAPDVDAGASLSRKPDGRDSDCNAADFVAARPTPGWANFYERDLALSVRDMPLPCAGQPFEAGIILENAGLERFTGSFCINLSIEEQPVGDGTMDGGSLGDGALIGGTTIDGHLFDISLEPGESVSVALAFPAAPPGAFCIEISLTASGDENELNDTAVVRARSSPGEVVINEIMYRPASGGSEWLELRCGAPGPISLGGWQIADATGSKRLISAEELVIEPGGFLVLAQDSGRFCADYPRCPSRVTSVAGGWPWLNDTDDGARADLVELRDDGDVLVELVEYRDLLDDERGRSIERFSSEVCSAFPGGLWHRSVAADRSTPGAENSIDLGVLPAPAEVRIEPNPYHPARDGIVEISGMTAAGEEGLLVRIFDLGGMETIKLFGERGGARVFSCDWDGRDGSGRDVGTGLYICIVEFVRSGGGVCRREKRCIALYR